MRWWADRVAMPPSNVGGFAAKKDWRSGNFRAWVLVDGPRPEHFALDEGHVVGVDNNAAEVVHQSLEAADATLETHKVFAVQACEVVHRVWRWKLTPALANLTHALGLGLQNGPRVGAGHENASGGSGERRHVGNDAAQYEQA